MKKQESDTSLEDMSISEWSQRSSSSQHYGSTVNSLASMRPKTVEQPAIAPRQAYVTAAVLCFLNLLKYMERNILIGVVPNVQRFFNVGDTETGLIQTVFICSSVLWAPLFGYLGDRYNRKYIMMCGLSVGIVTAFGSSFLTESYFWLMVSLRILVAIGDSSCSTLAPTIISDLFRGGQRTSMFCALVTCLHFGSGLGLIVGAGSATLTGDWRWAFRITPILGVVGVALLGLFCPHPERGAAESHGKGLVKTSSYPEDVKYLLKNKSFVWATLSLTVLNFGIIAKRFWMPTFLSRARATQGIRPECTIDICDSTDSHILGAVVIVSGLLGGVIGVVFSKWFRDKMPNVDPLICTAGILGSTPFSFIIIFVATESIPITFVFIFLEGVLLAVHTAILPDMVLYVVIPTRRATAEALHFTFYHLLGDAGSPYLVGLISDAISASKPATSDWSFLSLQYSLLICPCVIILSGLCQLMTSIYITEDKKAAQLIIEEDSSSQQDPAPQISVETSSSTDELNALSVQNSTELKK